MSGPCTDCGGPDYQTLTARIAELEAELAEAVIERDMNYKTMVLYMEKKEQAEARTIATEEDWKKRQNEARELLTKKEAHIEDCHRAIEQAKATIWQMTNSLQAIREEHEDIPALVKFIDGELSRWAEKVAT